MSEPTETPCAHPEDLALVRAVLARDPASLEAFAARLACVSAFLRSLAKPFLERGGLDIEDLRQDVFATVWSRLDSFDGRCQLETWLWGYCRNRVQKWFARASDDIVCLAEGHLHDLVDESAGEPGSGIDDELLRAEVDRLERPVAEVVHLKHFGGLSFPEIATRLSISSNTAKARYYRGLRILRSRLDAFAPIDHSA